METAQSGGMTMREMVVCDCVLNVLVAGCLSVAGYVASFLDFPPWLSVKVQVYTSTGKFYNYFLYLPSKTLAKC